MQLRFVPVAAGPLLGLIATVVGMIVTFQSITESGSSDPKLMANGIGQAMIEEAVYNDDGQLMTGSFMDYALPRAIDFPRFELHSTVTPTPVNPLGAKGVGEAGTLGSTPCIVSAAVDALSAFGVTHIDMMLRPEKLWHIIHGGQA